MRTRDRGIHRHLPLDLARRVGLRLEAHHVQDWYSKGEWTDTLVYARLASES